MCGLRQLCVLLSGLLPAAVLAAVSPSQLAIVINTNDPDSRETGRYYRQQRHIPEQNIIEIALPVTAVVSEQVFNQQRQALYRQTPANVQFYALAWTQPYRVGCMSITSAITFGFDKAYCAKGCNATRRSAYYNFDGDAPYDSLGIRPSMLLAGSSPAQVEAMIDRGVKSDGSFPGGTAYLLSTTDKARNVRAWRYPVIRQRLSSRLKIQLLEADALKDKHDVLFYFTGRARVQAVQSNRFLPGAIADHLTSWGGVLFGKKQMSVLKWLDAGATGSYGTVIEPCAFTQKFPNPGIVIDRYTRGESLIEAYWKSVAWPGQGLFVGEPLASPFATRRQSE
ncbi:MAG TPA: TIGR03790 family protein [Thiotrichales bacterium]|nr:TIGR03790 family protein [Thiotrichales bacterium]